MSAFRLPKVYITEQGAVRITEMSLQELTQAVNNLRGVGYISYAEWQALRPPMTSEDFYPWLGIRCTAVLDSVELELRNRLEEKPKLILIKGGKADDYVKPL